MRQPMPVASPMNEQKSAPNYSVPALEKGLAVLELLAAASEPLSLSQISEKTQNSTSQLFRTMTCLAESGFVFKHDVSGKYMLTLKLFELANRHSPLEHLLQVATLPMQELAWTIRESCHISIMQQRQLLVVGQVESPEKVQIFVSVGATFSLARTVSGRLLLSAMDDRNIEMTLQQDPDYCDMSAAEREQFWRRVAEIRRSGISSAVDESFIGLKDTAVLVGNPDVGVTAAVAVTQLIATRQSSEPHKVEAALRQCAREINERAGLSYGQAKRYLVADPV